MNSNLRINCGESIDSASVGLDSLRKSSSPKKILPEKTTHSPLLIFASQLCSGVSGKIRVL